MTDHERIKQALELNQEPQRIHRYYDDWSATYNQDVADERYRGPHTIARMASRLYTVPDSPDRPRDSDTQVNASARCLDAGCGTGLAGASLFDAGFTQLTGIDLSPNMIVEAEKTGCYQALYAPVDLTRPLAEQLRTLGQPGAHSDLFDLTVCVGVFTLGHVPPVVLQDLVNVTRPGGLILATARKEYCEQHPFEDTCRELEASGSVHLLHAEWDEYVSNDQALYVALSRTSPDL